MAALLKLVQDVRNMADLPAALHPDPWASATEAQRRVADLREVLVSPLADLVNRGASINNAAGLLAAQIECRDASAKVSAALAQLGVEAVSLPTLKRWLSDYLKQGKNGLLPQHTGRVRKDYGWEARAVALYNAPSKPAMADVSWNLRAEGFADATPSRVVRYLKALPATLGKHSPARIGHHLHKLTRRRFQRRHLDDVLVGEIYVGDGHTCDVYVAHPNTGGPFRPELTLFLDLKSRKVVGWWLTHSESAVSTLYSLSYALRAHQHVPAWLYIDRGSGYRSKMLTDENVGWYRRFDIEVIGALPGNPHGKGWVESFFRQLRDKHDKFFANGMVYAGNDMAHEVNRRMSVDLSAGRRELPSLADYVASLTRFFEQWDAHPMDALGRRTPNEVWAGLQRIEVGVPQEAVMRPRAQPTVARQQVRLHNRFYFHESLALYDGKKVTVEYDLHDDGRVWVLDQKGRFICEATLEGTVGPVPVSRLEEQRQKRLDGQIKRLERHAAEARARAQDAITVADTVAGIELVAGSILPAPTPVSQNPFDFDITDWSDE